ncbi:Uu.00g100450.m01.CDS01 [Anthostomella pinea]|uniref:Uu.00g100450.m01.CDS01 n=1 Tax=Anthostomella pinea TaxID=933095 RepID=A0AAI8YFB1_9PEZI|nr:Uu.00g100450.m01.CDS01 [Anthostomella pinea]
MFKPTYWIKWQHEKYGETRKQQQEDPFYCECRAYGRLKETRNENLAIKTYGYIIFDSDSDNDEFVDTIISDGEPSTQKAFRGNDYHRFNPTHLRVTEDVRPGRGIVKQLVQDKPEFRRSMIPQMMKDIESLHKLGIYVGGNIRADAYLDGKLIDFSRAWTVPHDRLDGEMGSPDDLTGFEDFEAFDHLIDRWNEEHPRQQEGLRKEKG